MPMRRFIKSLSQPETTAVIYMVLSTMFAALFAFFGKVGVEELPFSLLLFFRFFIPLVLIVPIFVFSGVFKKFHELHNIGLQLLRAFVEVICQYCFFGYLLHGTLLHATLFWSSAPLFMPLFYRLFHGYRSDKANLMAIMIGLIGVICIIKPDKGIFDPYSILGVLVAVTSALSQILNGLNREKHSNEENLIYFFTFTSVLSFIPLGIYAILYLPESLRLKTALALQQFSVWTPLLAISITTILIQTFRGIAFKRVKPLYLGPLFYLAIPFSGLIEYWMYGVSPDFLSVIGSLLIILSSFIKRDMKSLIPNTASNEKL
jgi:drug/metabolite transporter (DMT)-like permease